MRAFGPVRSHGTIFRLIPLTASLSLALAACDESPSAAEGCGRTLRLDVGEAAEVQGGPECPLRAEGGAEYVLAYYDARLSIGARTEGEPYLGADERFVVMVDDVTGGARAAAASATAELARAVAPPADVDVRFSTGGAGGGPVGTGPWAEGDSISFNRADCLSSCVPYTRGRVARVLDNWLVFVAAPSLEGQMERVVSLFDQAAPLVRQHALPLLHASFTAQRPVTTATSGQLVVLFEPDVSAGNGVTHITITPQGTATHWIRLELTPDLDQGRMLWLLAHEIAHAFQFEYIARTPPLAGPRGMKGGARWGVEGGATLVDTETQRRAAGVPLAGNASYDAEPPTEVHGTLFRNAGARTGVLTGGYHSSAPFLRDLVFRRMDRGDSEDAAFREVLRGAMEGWHGVGDEGSRRPGLVERMRARVPDWDPADAVLTWTLSAAADDRVESTVYRDRTWLRTGDWEGRGRGWEPDRIIQAGSGASERITRPAGSSGYVLVRSPSGRVELELTAIETVRWKLLRVS